MSGKHTFAVRDFTRFSLLASLTALMQIAPGLIPGPGHVLSALGTLPVAVAAFISPRGGMLVAFVSAWLTFMVQPSEAPILILCTGPLGVILGTGLHRSARPITSIVMGTLTLGSGVLVLTFGLGMPAFGPLLSDSNIIIFTGFVTGFSLLYNWAWFRFLRSLLKKLGRTGFIPTPQIGNKRTLL